MRKIAEIFIPETLYKWMSRLRSPWAAWRTGDSSKGQVPRLSGLGRMAACGWSPARPRFSRTRGKPCVAEIKSRGARKAGSLSACTTRSGRTSLTRRQPDFSELSVTAEERIAVIAITSGYIETSDVHVEMNRENACPLSETAKRVIAAETL